MTVARKSRFETETVPEVWQHAKGGFWVMCPICDQHEPVRRYHDQVVAERARVRHESSRAHKEECFQTACDDDQRQYEWEEAVANDEPWAMQD